MINPHIHIKCSLNDILYDTCILMPHTNVQMDIQDARITDKKKINSAHWKITRKFRVKFYKLTNFAAEPYEALDYFRLLLSNRLPECRMSVERGLTVFEHQRNFMYSLILTSFCMLL